MHKTVSRDCSITLPRVISEDETQQSVSNRLPVKSRRWRRWLGRIARATRNTEPEPLLLAAPDGRLDVHATFHALPTLLDSSSLPNGIVELLIEDFETPTRQLFDIHDGRVTLVEPGKCVPWASIAGPATAWAMALGPERDTADLKLTGDTRLAQRVLAALPSQC
jgi:hypothetical protein